MAVRIRLKRMGAKKQPSYRIVVADSRSARDGRYVAQLGHYNPLREPPEVRVDVEQTLEWLSKGAQPSESVKLLLERAGVWRAWQERRRGAGREAPAEDQGQTAAPAEG
ncbi:MAG: 30S ribosomal protein S16 [Limnochordaceae bacterium]|nr:30S ribosomal protein S16 [Limnochordaceae bacterium]